MRQAYLSQRQRWDLNRTLELWQVKELGLVTPYILAVNNAIRRNYWKKVRQEGA